MGDEGFDVFAIGVRYGFNINGSIAAKGPR